MSRTLRLGRKEQATMPSLNACLCRLVYHIVVPCQEGSHVGDIDIATMKIINVVFNAIERLLLIASVFNLFQN